MKHINPKTASRDFVVCSYSSAYVANNMQLPWGQFDQGSHCLHINPKPASLDFCLLLNSSAYVANNMQLSWGQFDRGSYCLHP